MGRCRVVGCFLCYLGRRGRTMSRGHFGWSEPSKQGKGGNAMGLKKPAGNGTNGVGMDTLRSGLVWGARPSLAEFMTDGEYEDGSKRVLPTLMVFVGDGQWQAWLHDREEARGCFASGSTLEEALGALDEGLCLDTLSWRRDGSRRR